MIQALLTASLNHAALQCGLEDRMSEAEIERRMAELDRLLNDPETRMDAERVWAILAEIKDLPSAQHP